MKPGVKLGIMFGLGIVVWGLIAWACFSFGSKKNDPKMLAEKALYACVDNPSSVEIIAVSKPDSVFGRDFITMDEKMAISISMMNISQKVMSFTNDLDDIDFENPELMELMQRQMSALSVLRSLVPYNSDAEKPQPFNGWKVKVEYKAKSEAGFDYHSEYWFIMDKDATCVVNSFEIPILEQQAYDNSDSSRQLMLQQLISQQ